MDETAPVAETPNLVDFLFLALRRDPSQVSTEGLNVPKVEYDITTINTKVDSSRECTRITLLRSDWVTATFSLPVVC